MYGIPSLPPVQVTFPNYGPNTYYIQVDGAGGARGLVTLTSSAVRQPPYNDNFNSAEATFPASGTTEDATLETGEPLAGPGASGSVWYKFVVPLASGATRVRVRLEGAESFLMTVCCIVAVLESVTKYVCT